MAQQRTLRASISSLRKYTERCMLAAGASNQNANIVSEILVEADARGVHSHGMNRLKMYVDEILNKEVIVNAVPTITTETPAIAHIDGNNGLGMVVGHYSMNIAIRKAREMGVGLVSVTGSNHYGIAGYYSMMATKEKMIGMSVTSTSPLVYPTRGTKPILGTNPIAVSAPSLDPAAPFDLDMATSAVPIGKVELADTEKRQVPQGWGVEKGGQMTTNPRDILDGGGLLPLGGAEETAGYKGYGLGAVVEIFCGILGNANYGSNVPPWRQGRGKAANIGQCFIAVNPALFHAGFESRMSGLLSQLHETAPVEKDKPVLTAGEAERAMRSKYEQEGVHLHPNLVDQLGKIADQLKVKRLELM